MQAAEQAAKLSSFVNEMIRQVVTKKDEVKVTTKLDGHRLYLIIDVNPVDRGFIIGKQGRTAKSLRTIIVASGIRRGLTCELDIVGDDRLAL